MSDSTSNLADLSLKTPKPFFRWAGSKRLILADIQKRIRPFHGRYIEPFLGGGSLFLRLKPESALLGDALAPLMDAWRYVARDPLRLAERIEAWPRDVDTYEAVSALIPADELEAAARFLYLNRNSYGGVWRLNQKGEYNVPWSASKTETILDRSNLAAVSRSLAGSYAELICDDFLALTSRAQRGDFVFLDPPYSLGRATRPFVHYNEDPFSLKDQARLASEAARLRASGVQVLVTNSAHPDIADMYPGFERHDVARSSALANRAGTQRTITERIFFSE